MYHDALPLSAVLVITLVIVLAAIEVGYRLGRWRQAQLGGHNESEAQLSSMTGAHLALLAFIMAFSFSMAAGHYGDRRELVQKDANAIGTAYLRASLIEAPETAAIQELLLEYTAMRAKIETTTDFDSVIRRSDEIHQALWQQVQSLTSATSPNVLQSLLIQSLNDVFDVHNDRMAAGLKNRVPPSLWLVLAALLTLSMLGIGYFSGNKGHRNPIASTGLALSFSLILLLIADLDRPAGGSVRADQFAMINLLETLQRSP